MDPKQRYTAEDFDIFVVTCNRAHLLRETLESLSQQTARGFRVTIVDNASGDATPEVVDAFSGSGFRYRRHPVNIGALRNYESAIAMGDRTWIVLFHDDDLMHPRYIETLVALSNLDSRLVLLGSCYRPFTESAEVSWANIEPQSVRHSEPLNAGQFAGELFAGLSFAFCSVAYRREFLVNYSFNEKDYGKISDTPLMLQVASHGRSLIIYDDLIHYRRHQARSSVDSATGPFEQEILNLNKMYRAVLNESPLEPYGRVYLSRALSFLVGSFGWGGAKGFVSLVHFLRRAIHQGAIGLGALVVGVAVGFPASLIRRLTRASSKGSPGMRRASRAHS